MRRVVISGMGIVSSIGNNTQEVLASLREARSGIVVAGVGMLVATLASFLYYFGVNDAALPHLCTNVALAAVALASEFIP